MCLPSNAEPMDWTCPHRPATIVYVFVQVTNAANQQYRPLRHTAQGTCLMRSPQPPGAVVLPSDFAIPPLVPSRASHYKPKPRHEENDTEGSSHIVGLR